MHDIASDGHIIDHILIGPPGVLEIETETCSKPPRSPAVVTVQDSRILKNGHEPDRDPIVHVRAAR